MKYIELVEQFHKAFDYIQPSPTSPNLSNRETNQLRIRLLQEESMEFIAGVHDGSRIEILDALCDFQYVLSGAIIAWGLAPKWNMERVHETFSGDVITYWTLIESAIMDCEEESKHEFDIAMFSSLTGIQFHLNSVVKHLGFESVFWSAFCEVHRSNMSKLWKLSELPQGDHGFSVVPSMGGYIVKRGDGKILKSPSYSPANLEQFV